MGHALNVMTFNIRHGRALDGRNRWYKRRSLVFDTIRSRSPHVLGLQEVDPHQLDELRDTFPTFGVIAHRRYGGIFGAYAPVLFDAARLEAGASGDFWLSPDPDGERKRAWDSAVVRLCTWAIFVDRSNGERFAVLNSHFDQRGVEARRKSAELVVDRLAALGHMPRLFIGDINAKERYQTWRILTGAGLRDSFRVLYPDAEPAFTFHAFNGVAANGSHGKIDYVFCDDKWRVLSAEIVRDASDGRWPSDHFPVAASLEIVGR
jgi:endonuclease/exonuclease/phosphatase family metal-dependent hydrolase